MVSSVPAWGVGSLENAVLDVFERLMALPTDIRMNLVAAVEAAATIEAIEGPPPS